MSKSKILDHDGLKIYDQNIKAIIKANAYFVGTQEEYNTAYSNGSITDGMLVILTDDNDSEDE